MTARITFCGGAGTVTGANFLFDTGDMKLLVDCGALEREHTGDRCDLENAKPFAYDPRSIQALFITHAHQDHIGRVPKLVRDGFRGRIFSTPATKDLSAVMFDDALSIMGSDSEKYGCTPMYEKEDVSRALSLWQTHEYHEPFAIGDASVEFLDAGHILGSAMIKFSRGEKNIVFTGDIGNTPEPLLNDVESLQGAQYVVMESVYGDRLHEERQQRREVLKQAVLQTIEKRGTLLVPSFSIERTQILLFELNEMLERGEIARIPVYLDAPLASRVTVVFEKYRQLLNPVAQKSFEHGKDPFEFSALKVVTGMSGSHALDHAPGPKIIIAGSGMSTGGRVRSHEKTYLPDQNATILLVGYQAPGSLGRRIQDGQTNVHIEGQDIRVRAQIEMLSGYSGHADRDQLLDLVSSAGDSLKKAFVVMGEPRASLFLAQRIQDFLGIEADAPATGEHAEIDW